MTRTDPHSYFDSSHPRTRHLHFEWSIDFDERSIEGRVALELDHARGGTLDLDTKRLTIHSAHGQNGEEIGFTLGDEEPILGSRLRLQIPEGVGTATIAYRTSVEAVALQWFEPEMTLGKRHPFMYSQCQAIHARSIVPCQDTPAARISYTADVLVPEALTAVMSAGPAGSRPGGRKGTRTFSFRMPQPIPPYLLAVAVGDLASRELSSRSRVWAEPEMVDRAASEFEQVEGMILAAENLFGPYEWERYDMLVLPPAFPFGGMENPRMTFLTPTVIAGDRSLVDVIAHELAHSWTGNLVTNATMEHFWLNEGFTTWAERRILDALHGEESSALRWAIGQKSLEESMARFGIDSPLTKLRTTLSGVDPDDAFSSIPYEKGARFVSAIEREVGRERFGRFMRDYIKAFRFTSITSEQFLEFLDRQLPGTALRVDAEAWLHGTGMPASAPAFASSSLDELVRAAEAFSRGVHAGPEQTGSWRPDQILIFLQRLPRTLDHAALSRLDRTFSLNEQGNYEILVEWLTIAGGSDYEPAFERLRQVLREVGRMKYLRPLYAALGAHPRTRALAREIYESGKGGYHALSRRVIESEMEKYQD